jgi:hypothetical protein
LHRPSRSEGQAAGSAHGHAEVAAWARSTRSSGKRTRPRLQQSKGQAAGACPWAEQARAWNCL